MASFLFLLSSLFIFFFSSTAALPSETIYDAADILTDAGYVSMSLTLEIIAESILEQSPSATVFAPSDSAFKKSGQPSLDLLRYHLVMLPLPIQSFRRLPAGAKLPTMLPGQSLTVTTSTSDHAISLNNIKINEMPIYDDGVLLVYGIDRFFDPSFQYQRPSSNPNPNPSCTGMNRTMNSSDSFDQAIQTLKTSGYSAMASFLGMQLSGDISQNGITVFAPADENVINRLGVFDDYPSFFRRHVVPCKFLWNDLVDFVDGTALPTFLEGFTINITRTGGVLILNGVPVYFPDAFFNDRVVVHGVSEVLAVPEDAASAVEDADSFSDDEQNLFDPGEF
ncbi:putative fasciclin-like arabinogalactan protein 20 [Vicia villosa]|uniref:putative fasciclin-like arabinogalactan protein 20 n=1 Tax=Vicia villosa TaxID=3911 RepID=UPI00273A9591|nr:putative fasciclin-like arabinogalactan protein 20 [Vicia villosa]